MLTTVTHASGIIEVVEASDPPDSYHYVAPWEEDGIQTRANGTKFIVHDGSSVDVESYADEFGGTCYRGRLETSPS